ncbi:hypothetical protein ACFFGJ_09480 [Cellulomonas phragmiteti]
MIHSVACLAAGGMTVVGVHLTVQQVVALRSAPDDSRIELLGVALAAGTALLGGALLAVTAVLVVLTVVGRRRAAQGRTRLLFGVSVAGSVLAVLAVLPTTADPAYVAFLGVLVGPYLVATVGTAVVTRP